MKKYIVCILLILITACSNSTDNNEETVNENEVTVNEVTEIKDIDLKDMSHEEFLNILDGKYFAVKCTGVFPYYYGPVEISPELIIGKLEAVDNKLRMIPEITSGMMFFPGELIYEPLLPGDENYDRYGDDDAVNFINIAERDVSIGDYTYTEQEFTALIFNGYDNEGAISFYTIYESTGSDNAWTFFYDGYLVDDYSQIKDKNIETKLNADFMQSLSKIKGYVVVKTDNLNMRMDHSKDSERLGTAKNGYLYIVDDIYVGQDYTWYRVGGYNDCWIADDGTWLTFTPSNN